MFILRVALIFISYFLIKSAVAVFPITAVNTEPIPMFTAQDFLGVLLFQPFNTIISLALGILGILFVRHVLKEILASWFQKGFRSSLPQSGQVFLFMLSLWFLYLSISLYPGYIGVLFTLFFIVDFVRFMVRRRKLKQTYRKVAQESQL